jgi:hypothetical protein
VKFKHVLKLKYSYRKLIIAVILTFLMPNVVWGFVHIPYRHMSNGSLIFNMKYRQELEADSSLGKKQFGSYGANFCFKNLAYGITGITIKTRQKTSWAVGHNLFWEPFNINVPFLNTKHSVQCGKMNLGIAHGLPVFAYFNESNRDTLKGVFVTYRAQLISERNIFGYFSYASSLYDKGSFKPYFGVAVEESGHEIYFETDTLSYYVGIKANILTNGHFELYYTPMVKASLNGQTVGANAFYTENIFTRIEETTPMKYRLSLETAMLMEDGLIAFNHGKFEEALAIYLKILDRRTDLPIVYVRLGSIYYQLENFPKARHMWLKAKKLDPYNKEITVLLEDMDQ